MNSGAEAEQFAAEFLGKNGLRLLERNYHCRFGEIDLIMQEGSTLVFVEVRMRRSKFFGGAAYSITPSKQTRLLRAARHYLSGMHHHCPCRFDAILLGSLDSDNIEWIKNAFGE